jgi:hypothetical protein
MDALGTGDAIARTTSSGRKPRYGAGNTAASPCRVDASEAGSNEEQVLMSMFTLSEDTPSTPPPHAHTHTHTCPLAGIATTDVVSALCRKSQHLYPTSPSLTLFPTLL